MQTETPGKNRGIEIVEVLVKNKNFIIDMKHVKEIVNVSGVLMIPGTDPSFEGIINMKGMIIPVINLGRRMGYESIIAGESTRILICEIHNGLVGYLVDSIIGLRILSEIRKEEKVPESKFVKTSLRCDKQYLDLLDLEKIAKFN